MTKEPRPRLSGIEMLGFFLTLDDWAAFIGQAISFRR